MLHKIVYDVIFNPSKKYSRTGDGMIMIRASQGRKSVDIPTNIFCQSKQFSDGYINSLHPQFDGLNASTWKAYIQQLPKNRDHIIIDEAP